MAGLGETEWCVILGQQLTIVDAIMKGRLMMKKKKSAPSAHCPDFQDDNMAALDELLQKDDEKLDALLEEILREDSEMSKMIDTICQEDNEYLQKLLTTEQDTTSLECVVCTRQNRKKVK